MIPSHFHTIYIYLLSKSILIKQPCIIQSFIISRTVINSPTNVRKYSTTKRNTHSIKRFHTLFDDDIEKQTNHSSSTSLSSSKSLHVQNFLKWGTHNEYPTPKLPQTVESVAYAIYEAITCTIYGKQRLDPKIVSNARVKSILFDYRPHVNSLRQHKPIQRMGIELDGIRFLSSSFDREKQLPSLLSPSRNRKTSATSRKIEEDLEMISLINLSLILACKLSQKPWKHVEEVKEEPQTQKRPVILYFTTIHETLIASRQLLQLRRHEQHQEKSNNMKESIYDTIEICCLNDNSNTTTTLPPSITSTRTQKPKRGRKPIKPISKTCNEIILVVKPNIISSVTFQKFQSLLAQSSIANIPTILISPRFVSTQISQEEVGHCYYEQSSSYGGYEPAKFYYPWILRDFIPPIYTFILQSPSSQYLKEYPNTNDMIRLGLCQSVMDMDHSWHVFTLNSFPLSTSFWNMNGNSKNIPKDVYEYVASTNTFSGRPNLSILYEILRFWDGKIV